jgi:hypothetical protein
VDFFLGLRRRLGDRDRSAAARERATGAEPS